MLFLVTLFVQTELMLFQLNRIEPTIQNENIIGVRKSENRLFTCVTFVLQFLAIELEEAYFC